MFFDVLSLFCMFLSGFASATSDHGGGMTPMKSIS
jgi:hypothetical protein